MEANLFNFHIMDIISVIVALLAALLTIITIYIQLLTLKVAERIRKDIVLGPEILKSQLKKVEELRELVFKKKHYKIGNFRKIIESSPPNLLRTDGLEEITLNLPINTSLSFSKDTFDFFKRLETLSHDPNVPFEIRSILKKFKFDSIIPINSMDNESKYFHLSISSANSPRKYYGEAYENTKEFLKTLIELRNKINDWSGGIFNQ